MRTDLTAVDLTDRHGDGYVTFFMAFMPLAIVLLMLATNGLSVAFGYRQALGLARMGALAGAPAVSFDGGRPGLSTGEACQRALDSLRANGAGTLAGFKATCGASSGALRVTVKAKAVLVMPDVFGIFPDTISVVAESTPASGIDRAD